MLACLRWLSALAYLVGYAGLACCHRHHPGVAWLYTAILAAHILHAVLGRLQERQPTSEGGGGLEGSALEAPGPMVTQYERKKAA